MFALLLADNPRSEMVDHEIRYTRAERELKIEDGTQQPSLDQQKGYGSVTHTAPISEEGASTNGYGTWYCPWNQIWDNQYYVLITSAGGGRQERANGAHTHQ